MIKLLLIVRYKFGYTVPHTYSDSLLKYIGITITIANTIANAKKWVQYPLVSNIANAIAIWK